MQIDMKYITLKRRRWHKSAIGIRCSWCNSDRSNSREEFLGIGMDKPMALNGGEVVAADTEKIVAVYPHRDAERTKMTEETRNVILMICGVPGISAEKLRKAESLAVEYVTRICGGEPGQ